MAVAALRQRDAGADVAGELVLGENTAEVASGMFLMGICVYVCVCVCVCVSVYVCVLFFYKRNTTLVLYTMWKKYAYDSIL